MMTIIQELMAKFYQLIIIVLAVLILILGIGFGVQTWRVSHWKTQSKNADAKCITQIQKIEQTQQTALKQANDKANQASADYEELKATQQVKIQTVRDTVQKIVERPVYRNVCLDSDGLQQLGKAISLGKTNNTSKSSNAVSEPDNSK
ncbi:hypothetical protein [Acinetobacter sp. ANC 4640]